MQTIHNPMQHSWWTQAEPLSELAQRVLNELEAELRDFREVSLDEMKRRIVIARREQVMAG